MLITIIAAVLQNLFVTSLAGIAGAQNDIHDNRITTNLALDGKSSSLSAYPFDRFEYKQLQDGVEFGCYWHQHEMQYFISDSQGRRIIQKHHDIWVHHADGHAELKQWASIELPKACEDKLAIPSDLTYVRSCAAGYQGTPPNCLKVENRQSLVVEKACPEGQTGAYPFCYQLCCPSHTRGEYPNCICGPGYEGTFPYCERIQTPVQKTPEAKCMIITPPTSWEIPPDCPCMLRLPPMHDQYLPPARDYLPPPSREYLPINRYLPPKTIATMPMRETRCEGKFPTAHLSLPIPMLYVPFCSGSKPMSNIDSAAMGEMFPNALAVPYTCSRCQSNTLFLRNGIGK